MTLAIWKRALTTALALGLAPVAIARAESTLRLPLPAVYGSIPAATFDDDGKRIGDANLSIERVDEDHVRLRSETDVQGKARTVATALMRFVDDGTALQLVRQESRSTTPEGKPLGTLLIDHDARIVVCNSTDPKAAARRQLYLPSPDRVVNVPFNLLFQALVEDRSRTVEFDLLLCRPSPRFMTFSARVDRVLKNRGSHAELVEVVYRPDLGFLSFVTNVLVPRLSFWFDPAAENTWVAHRMPLYAMGPEVVILNDDSAYADLDADR